MYPVDELDTVVALGHVPRPDVGAPLPVVLADEWRLLLAYIVSEPDPNWDGTSVRMVSPECDGLPVAVARFDRPSDHMFGAPNDEAFSGHPLAERGLRPYAVFEIQQSSWIRQLRRMTSVHPQHRRDWFMEGKKHFVFAFHDSTFECIAHGFDLLVHRGSIVSALDRMVELLTSRP